MSIYLQFIKLNNQSNSIPHDLIILRPATHSEVLLIDKNYKSIQSSSKISCPCILLMGRNTMIIGFPPILIAGLEWKNQIPNFDDWMNSVENVNNCKLCGSNILFKNTEFCCKFHEYTYNKFDVENLNSNGWNLTKGIIN